MTTETALTIPERAAVALNSAKITNDLRALVAQSSDIVSVIDSAGREQAHRIGMNLKGARIAIEKTGKAAREDATAFSKGVIAEESRLVAIIEPEESRVFGLRDKWDAEREAEKQAKVAAERQRIDAIHYRIGELSKFATMTAGRNSEFIQGLMVKLEEFDINEELYMEFVPQAITAKAESGAALQTAYDATHASEQAAEAERIKREEEDRQRAAEAAENAKQKAELDRVAAEQAAERKRLDDAAEAKRAELARAQKEADEKIKAQAAAETARIQAESDARALEHAKAMQALSDQRAAFEAEQSAAQKVKDDAAKLEADHAEALRINEIYSLDVEDGGAYSRTLFHADGKPVYLSSATVEMVSTAAKCVFYESAMSQGFSPELIADALIADALDLAPLHEAANEPTDAEIIAVYMDAFGGTKEQAIERLSKFAKNIFDIFKPE